MTFFIEITQGPNFTDVEIVDSRPQFSTSVEVRVGIVGRSVGRLVSEHVFSKTALRIFLIFCMKVQHDNGSKRTRPFVREKSGSFNNHENVFLLILQFQIDFYGNLKTRDVKKGVFITVQVHDYKYF